MNVIWKIEIRENLFSVRESADLIGCSESTIRGWAADGLIRKEFLDSDAIRITDAVQAMICSALLTADVPAVSARRMSARASSHAIWQALQYSSALVRQTMRDRRGAKRPAPRHLCLEDVHIAGAKTADPYSYVKVRAGKARLVEYATPARSSAGTIMIDLEEIGRGIWMRATGPLFHVHHEPQLVDAMA